jgi:hypothetical protein
MPLIAILSHQSTPISPRLLSRRLSISIAVIAIIAIIAIPRLRANTLSRSFVCSYFLAIRVSFISLYLVKLYLYTGLALVSIHMGGWLIERRTCKLSLKPYFEVCEFKIF